MIIIFKGVSFYSYPITNASKEYCNDFFSTEIYYLYLVSLN
jgi:hypothetical protein